MSLLAHVYLIAHYHVALHTPSLGKVSPSLAKVSDYSYFPCICRHGFFLLLRSSMNTTQACIQPVFYDGANWTIEYTYRDTV